MTALACSLMRAGMLDCHLLNRRRNLEPVEFMAWKSRTLEKIDATAVGRHKQLAPASIERFNEIAARPLAAFGYI